MHFLCYLIISSLLYVLIHYYGKSILKAKIIRNEYEMLLHDNVFINIYLLMTYCYGHIAVNKKDINYFIYFYMSLIFLNILLFTGYIFEIKINFFHLINLDFISPFCRI